MAEIRPISFRAASNFVAAYHRHHRPPAGCKFCIGLYEGDVLIGVAMCGRPVSRRLDDGLTCEVNRLCTNGAPNACSQLYGAAARTAKAMGYRRIITYILASEDGAALKELGYVVINPAELDQVLPVKEMGYEGIMRIDLEILATADYLVQLPGWEDSKGANRELGFALGADKIVVSLEQLLTKEVTPS